MWIPVIKITRCLQTPAAALHPLCKGGKGEGNAAGMTSDWLRRNGYAWQSFYLREPP